MIVRQSNRGFIRTTAFRIPMNYSETTPPPVRHYDSFGTLQSCTERGASATDGLTGVGNGIRRFRFVDSYCPCVRCDGRNDNFRYTRASTGRPIQTRVLEGGAAIESRSLPGATICVANSEVEKLMSRYRM